MVHALADRTRCCCTVGVHPDNEGVAELSGRLLARAARPRVLAIGETGLDYYRLNGRSVEQMEWQRERFRVHIRVACTSGLPLVCTRAAPAPTRWRSCARRRGARGVFHCFTETREVRAALEMGFLDLVLRHPELPQRRGPARWREVPLDRCPIETDSPTAPVPKRGISTGPRTWRTSRPAWPK